MKITLFLSAKKNIYLIQSALNFSSQFSRNKNEKKKKSIYHVLGQYLMTFPFSFFPSVFLLTTTKKKKGECKCMYQ